MSSKIKCKYAPLEQHEVTSLHKEENGGNNVRVTTGNDVSNSEIGNLDDMDCEDEVSFHSYKRTSRYDKNRFLSRCEKNLRSLTNLEKILSFIIVVLIILLVAMFAINISKSRGQSSQSASSRDQPCVTRGCIEVANRVASSLNERVNPCEDFYQFSCGGWESNNPLPSGQSRWSSFNLLWQDNQAIMKNVLEMNTTSNSSAELKAKNFYESCLDMESINKLGARPLLDLIGEIGGWEIVGTWNESEFDFNKTLKTFSVFSTYPFFSFGVVTDSKHSNSNVITVGESGLSVGSRDMYINKTIETDELLSAYLEYMTDISVLLGADKNETYPKMVEVLELEKEIAGISIPLEEMRDEEKNYHRLTLGELKDIAPAVDWMNLLQSSFIDIANITIDKDEPIVTTVLSYLKKFSDIIHKTPKRVLSNYMVWRLVRAFISAMGQPFLDVQNKIHKVKYGSDMSCRERWRNCVGTVDVVLGQALGKLFIQHKFDETSKASAEKMVTAIKLSFHENLKKITWMDSMTKKKASEKADAVEDMIGFPDTILNITYVDEEYEWFAVPENGTYFSHHISFIKFLTLKELQLLRKPVLRNEWSITPPTVNAYYSPNKNVIVFPAGILQPPFYGSNFPTSLNYGGIGIVVGHELTHGFDDQGRQYDLHGNLKNWWGAETLDRFNNKAKCMVDQYGSFTVDGANVNGNLTIGENIADNGGLRLAYNAYQDWKKFNGSAELDYLLPSLNYTHEQLFFIAFAQLWCSVATPQYAQQQILTDVHSPAKFRVIGTVSNSPEFAEAFKCPLGSPMNPENKCTVW